MISTSELAKLAGVSQSTISRYLNDHPSISFETKEHVQKLALQQELYCGTKFGEVFR